MKEHLMNPNSVMTHSEYADANLASPIEDALERMYSQYERVEKAFAVLRDRLEPITQPQEPSEALTAMSGDKSSLPRSRVTARIANGAEDLSRLASRIEDVTGRLDI